MKLADLTFGLGDFSDTAALIQNLDLVITIDTSVAHLAGALGKPVWVMLPYVADWRWMLDREDSPWYPSMKLFRQPKAGDWEAVVARVAAELRRLAGAPDTGEGVPVTLPIADLLDLAARAEALRSVGGAADQSVPTIAALEAAALSAAASVPGGEELHGRLRAAYVGVLLAERDLLDRCATGGEGLAEVAGRWAAATEALRTARGAMRSLAIAVAPS
jgi:hypothetical protein